MFKLSAAAQGPGSQGHRLGAAARTSSAPAPWAPISPAGRSHRAWKVTLQDLSPEQIDAAGHQGAGQAVLAQVQDEGVAQRPRRRGLIADPRQRCARADVIIEAIVEKLDVKQKLFARPRAEAQAGAVLATNTSSLEIEEIARRCRSRTLHRPPLLQSGRAHAPRRGRARGLEPRGGGGRAAPSSPPSAIPARHQERAGLPRRVLAAYMMAAMARLDKGEEKEKIDEAARAFGMPIGPIELADTVGLDVLPARRQDPGPRPRRLAPRPPGRERAARQERGRVLHLEGRQARPRRQDLGRPRPRQARARARRPADRRKQRALDERVVENADLVDAGVIFGTGFAPFRGGPLHFKASEGKGHLKSPPNE